MVRKYLLKTLEDAGCYCDGEDAAGQWWVNSINSEECLVPNVETFALTTWAQILYELKVPCPAPHDSDYEVYVIWREHQMHQTPPPQSSGDTFK